MKQWSQQQGLKHKFTGQLFHTKKDNNWLVNNWGYQDKLQIFLKRDFK